MKVSVKKVDALRREMHFEVPQERVAKGVDEALKKISKHAKIPGFRPGKAPKDVVQKSHGPVAQEEMMKKLIPEVYQEGILQEKLDPIDFPNIDEVDVSEGILKFRATLDLRPDVEVKDYKGIKIAKKSAAVTDEEMAKTVDYLKKSRGLDEKAELDDDFAKGMGFSKLEDFKDAIKRNMEMDKENQNKQDVEKQMIDAVIKKSKLHVPQSLVDRQLTGRIQDFANRLKQYGGKDEDIQKRLKEGEKEFKEAAENDVKVFLIFHKIAEVEKIEAKEGENVVTKVLEFLLKEAKWEDVKDGK